MKSTILYSFILITSCSAATVSITNWELRNITSLPTTYTTGVGGGNYGNLDSIVHSFSGGDRLLTFSYSGDIDGCLAAGEVGAANDAFSFSLRLKGYTGSMITPEDTVAGTPNNVSLGNAYDFSADGAPTGANQHFGPGFDLDDNQSISISMENISYSRGEASVDESVTFDGFSAIGGYGISGSDFYFGTGSGVPVLDAAGNDGSINAADFPTVFPAQNLIISSDGNANRFRDLDFGFTLADSHTPIPEPSSSALLSLAGLALLARRRRSALLSSKP